MTFRVPGIPRPQGSKSYYNGRPVEASKYVKKWRRTVALAARASKPELLTGPCSVYLLFQFPRPKKPKHADYPAVPPDIDKLSRACLDAITGICFEDDGLVCQLTAIKKYADRDVGPGVSVTVERMD